MTAPEQKKTTAPLHVGALNALSRKPLTAARAARLIATATICVTIVSGILIHWSARPSPRSKHASRTAAAVAVETTDDGIAGLTS